MTSCCLPELVYSEGDEFSSICKRVIKDVIVLIRMSAWLRERKIEQDHIKKTLIFQDIKVFFMFKIPFSGFVTPRGDCANLWGRWRFVFHLEKIFPFQWSPEVSKICRWNNSAQLIIVAKIYPFGKNKSVWNKYFHLEQVLSFGRNILFGTNIFIWNKHFYLEQISPFETNIFIWNKYFHL